MGGKTQSGWIGSTVKVKERPVLGLPRDPDDRFFVQAFHQISVRLPPLTKKTIRFFLGVRNTVDIDGAGECIFDPESGPCTGSASHFRRCFLPYTCKKPYTFTHFFKIRYFIGIQTKLSVLVPIEKRYCTLMGGKTHSGWIGSTVKVKRRPVFGIEHSGPGH